MRRPPRTRTPRRVLVLGQQFDIFHYESATDITGSFANGLLGQCRPDARAIDLAHVSAGDQVGPDGYTDTVLHECLHAMVAVAHLYDTLSDKEDEAFVTRFTPILLDFIRRNPALVAWLQRRD